MGAFLNPILDELDKLTPQAKAALAQAHQNISAVQPPVGSPPAPPNTPPATSGAAPPAETAPPPPKPIGGPKIPQGLGMPSPEAEEDLSEYHRLTAPPLSRNDPLYHSKANTGVPGVQQIGNPFLRGLATVGDVASSFFPRAAQAIPGTTAHHNMLVNQQAKTVNEDVAGRSATAKQDLEEAQAEHAHAQAVATPLEKPTNEWVELKEPVSDPKHPELGPQPGFYNKNTGELHYGNVPMAAKPINPKEEKIVTNVHAMPSGEIVATHTDPVTGQSSAEVVYKGQPGLKTEVKQVEVKGKPHQILFNSQTGEQIRDLGPSGEHAKDFGVTLVNPQTNVLERKYPGQSIAPGAMTPNQYGSLFAPTTQMKNTGRQAELVHEQTPALLQEIDSMKDELGPLAGRWNEFIQGKVGMDNPKFAALRTDLLMYSSAVALMHARGRLPENLREEFQKAIDNPGQNFENLKATLQTIDKWTASNMNVMGRLGESTRGGPEVGTIEGGYRFKGGDPKEQANWEKVQ